MEKINSMVKRKGVDAGYHESSIDPVDRKGCIGTRGINKNYKLEDVINLAYEVNANIIIKGGLNAKWYLKKFPLETLKKEIQKQSWRDTSRYIMWIIKWDE